MKHRQAEIDHRCSTFTFVFAGWCWVEVHPATGPSYDVYGKFHVERCVECGWHRGRPLPSDRQEVAA